MRTGRALTVSGGGVCILEGFFGGEKKLKKKEKKKNWRTPPRKFQTPPEISNPPPPQKFQTPPKISDPPLPQKFQTPPPWDQARYPPPPRVDRQTPANLLPWPNFVAAGNYR